MKKIVLKFWCLLFLFVPSACLAAEEGFLNSTFAGKVKGFTNDVAGYGGYSTGTTVGLGSIIASIVMGFYAILGLIFIILIVLAGFKYMNARGDEQKTQEAIDQIRQAVIGLVIIIAAYAVTYFVFYFLPWGGTGGVGTPGGG